MRHASFAGRIGVARTDITPPVGIYCRNWGAARHDTAEGIHRPLTLTALTLQDRDGGTPLVFFDADLGWWANVNFAQRFRRRLVTALGLPAERIIFAMTHTHSAPPLTDPEPQWQGGALLPAFVEKIFQATVAAWQQAQTAAQPATLDWHTGRCALAANRDLPHGARIVCGYNPAGPADDTLLVGRVTSSTGKRLATLVNYACHPTTLAWDNRLVSPDFVGALRATVERHTDNAPTLFLQGASGELAPRYQYVADPAVADAHGRELGYAALATLEAMEPVGRELVFDGIVESGAALAVWRREPAPVATTLRAQQRAVELPVKDWPSAAELERQYRNCADRAVAERLRRKLLIRQAIGDGATHPLELWGWRIGDALLMGTAAEAYSILQQRVRASLPGTAVAWLNLINGSIGYLPPAAAYDTDIYQVWQTPFARGSLEQLETAARELAADLLAPD